MKKYKFKRVDGFGPRYLSLRMEGLERAERLAHKLFPNSLFQLFTITK